MDRADDVDTSKVVFREKSRAGTQSVLVAPGTRVELQIDVVETMTDAVLYMSQDVPDADVVVEQIAAGQFAIAHGHLPVSSWRRGKIVRNTLSPKNPLRILLVSRDGREVRVEARLAAAEKSGTYSIVHNKEK